MTLILIALIWMTSIDFKQHKMYKSCDEMSFYESKLNVGQVHGNAVRMREDRWLLFLSIFGFFDFLSAKILLPLGGLLISVYVAHIWGFNKFMDETNRGSENLKVTPIWGPVMKFLIPIIILVILIYGLAGENLA